MKIKITQKGANGKSVGEIVEIKGDTMPAEYVNKAVIVKEAKAVKVAAQKGAKPQAAN